MKTNKTLTDMHYIVFDGTRHFVCGFEDIESDYEIVHKSTDYDECLGIKESLNEEL